MLRDELTQDGSWAPEGPTKRLGAWSEPNLEGQKGTDLIWVQADDQWLNQSSLPYWKKKKKAQTFIVLDLSSSHQGTKILQAAQFGQKENFFFQICAVGTAQDFLAEVQ